MLYQLHEYNRALLGPVAELARTGVYMFSAPESWLAYLPGANRVAAGCELLYRLGKEYEKPAFGIETVDVRGTTVAVVEQTRIAKPFCRLQRFKRFSDRPDGTLSIVLSDGVNHRCPEGAAPIFCDGESDETSSGNRFSIALKRCRNASYSASLTEGASSW